MRLDGDSPAAMRYTEVRMSKIAHELLADGLAVVGRRIEGRAGYLVLLAALEDGGLLELFVQLLVLLADALGGAVDDDVGLPRESALAMKPTKRRYRSLENWRRAASISSPEEGPG